MLKTTHNTAETINLGQRFARGLKGGEVVLLVGDLGAGKTTFVQGVAKGVGIERTVNSPTFVLMKIYEVRTKKGARNQGARGKGGDKGQGVRIKNLVHIDTYRGLSIDDLGNIGALEYFGRPDTICFVEWGEGLEIYLRQKNIGYQKILIKNIDQATREFNCEKFL